MSEQTVSEQAPRADRAPSEPGPGSDAATGGMSTQPAAPLDNPKGIGVLGWLRWTWRQLTSMRTALLLLFLLALGSIPGSLLPQRNSDPVKVTAYLTKNPGLGKFFDRIGFFEVFGSPWFAAIYILLCISLAGCVIPRARVHFKAMRAQPPAAPSRLSRFTDSHAWNTDSTTSPQPEALLAGVADALKSKRWRVQTSDFNGTTGWVSAEKGYLRETGNLLFHVSLLVLLFSVAFGSLFGWRGQVLVVEGESFSNTVTQYDSFKPGRLVNVSSLAPFSLTLDKFSATYEPDGAQKGAPRSFDADVTFQTEPGAADETKNISVNSPLSVEGAKVFLIGHGYAPRIEVKDASGRVIYDAATVFLPTDANFSSNGVVKIPDTTPQLGLQGIFLPTSRVDPVTGPTSTFPAANDPGLFVSSWEGNLGLDNGVPQSVYELKKEQLKRTGFKSIKPGQTWNLPDNRGTVTFKGVSQFATFDVAHDPGKEAALAAAVLAILGLSLSLFVPRRRVWVRVTTGKPDAGGSGPTNRIEVAGLSRTDENGLRPVVNDLAAGLATLAPPVTVDITESNGSPANPNSTPTSGTLSRSSTTSSPAREGQE